MFSSRDIFVNQLSHQHKRISPLQQIRVINDIDGQSRNKLIRISKKTPHLGLFPCGRNPLQAFMVSLCFDK